MFITLLKFACQPVFLFFYMNFESGKSIIMKNKDDDYKDILKKNRAKFEKFQN